MSNRDDLVLQTMQRGGPDCVTPAMKVAIDEALDEAVAQTWQKAIAIVENEEHSNIIAAFELARKGEKENTQSP